jgi:two-component system CheB/CheR fusion protein
VGIALRKVVKEEEKAVLSGLAFGQRPAPALDITLQALEPAPGRGKTVLITFRERPLPASRPRRRSAALPASPEAAAELQHWKDEAQAVRLEMAATSEDLQAANEELQSTNEELQSANEELMTSKEEGQSMNEELQTLNNELQSRLDDLALSQSDMQNLLNSTDIATLFLDNALNVRRYTEQITRFIHLREIDIGRPLSELASSLNYPTLQADAKETLRTLKFIEKEITSTEGLWFLVRIKPYRTLADVIQGVVITLIDITAAKQLEARLRKG